jgi:hypothetical protein
MLHAPVARQQALNRSLQGRNVSMGIFFFLKDPIYLQSVTIHSANGGKGERWHVEEYSVALLC